LLNGSLVEGLASRTQADLQAGGANIVEISNGQFTEQTQILDYTGNPHTVQYFVEIFGVLPGNYTLEYDPDSPVDIIINLGVDWATKSPP
jgi:hypothetical protein